MTLYSSTSYSAGSGRDTSYSAGSGRDTSYCTMSPARGRGGAEGGGENPRLPGPEVRDLALLATVLGAGCGSTVVFVLLSMICVALTGSLEAGKPGGLEVGKPGGLEAGKPGGLEVGRPRLPELWDLVLARLLPDAPGLAVVGRLGAVVVLSVLVVVARVVVPLGLIVVFGLRFVFGLLDLNPLAFALVEVGLDFFRGILS